MRQTVKIDTERERFYRQYIELLKNLPPLNRLSNKDCNILAEFMRMNEELSGSFKEKEDPKKWELLFSSSIRKEIRERAGVTEASFNNSLSVLRKVHIIKGNTLSKAFVIYPSAVNKVSFEFRLKKSTGVLVSENLNGGADSVKEYDEIGTGDVSGGVS